MSATASASWNVKVRCASGFERAARRDDPNGVSRTRWVSIARASARPRPS